MRTLNLGILAHVDAGKTSLTERLLYAAGVIDAIGSVDDGSTQTDTLALERQRGITIKAAVVSFVIPDAPSHDVLASDAPSAAVGSATNGTVEAGVVVNLIDTPGHPDFIAEVERALSVLDGAVLVVSAVEGVQAQTRVLMRALQRLDIPTLLFVNKIDRRGADPERVLREIAEKLTPSVIAMGSVREPGTRGASFWPYGEADVAFTSRLADLLADHDDGLLAAYVEDASALAYGRLRCELAAQTRRALVHAVFFGSAITGAGVGALTAGLAELLPAAEGEPDGPLSGTVFKVERGPAGEKVAYVRLFSGTVRTRERLRFERATDPSGGDGSASDHSHQARSDDGRTDQGQKVTAVAVFERGAAVPSAAVVGGQIGKLWGLADVQIGDILGTPRTTQLRGQFAPPTLETVVLPRHPADRGRLYAALAQLAEQDPFINLRQDDTRQELSVSLYGEVQKEVIQATLADEYGIEVEFRETTTICVERPIGVGAAVEVMHKAPNPFLATVGLRVEPASIGTGPQFRLAVEVHGTMPPAFFKAIEDTVLETLRQGLYGWQVTDCLVTLTHTGYAPRQSHAHQRFDKSMSSTGADFRGLTPLVLMTALKQAGTNVYEPMHRFHLEIPADTLGVTVPALARLRAIPETQAVRGAAYVLEGVIPAARVYGLQQELPALTRGEGVLECAFDRYQPVVGPAPTRPRTDHNPLDRKEYLLHVTRRV